MMDFYLSSLGFWLLVLAFGFGLFIGVYASASDAKRDAVAHGCALWVADEGGKAVFTWKDE